ncbi:hypothetical protein J2Y54_000001 [Sphingomonas sp. BE123]|jgi:hypothetical protein|uniref:DUF6916 family protein n=1 Tax=unclassified Sphingomonas TaxID=196159 RepID=UPI0028674D41|nr:hypothetical protein [Sphingomonas sp. BE123]MDR6850508.1 hypothetical protein [Sphingomonas sp. BE123]
MQTSSTTRRSFVATGVLTTAAVAVSGCDGGAGTLTVRGTDSSTTPPLTKSEMGDWEKLVGTAFTIHGEQGRVTARLAPLVPAPEDANRPASLDRAAPFTAIFELDPANAPLGGQTYRLTHGTKGSFDLFLGHASTVFGKTLLSAVLN